MMETEFRSDAVDESGHNEVFAEVSLFGAELAGSDENGDCGCFNCDGNPCVK
jgi:hypothetical protein